jgi:hypothetical protein
MDSSVSTEAPHTPLSQGQKAWRVLVALATAGLLLLPGALTALAWTPINFLIAAGAIAAVAATASRHHWTSLPLAILGALLVGIPPYPNWLWYGDHGLVFHLGAALAEEPTKFVWFVVPAVALFAVLIMCFHGLRQAPKA